MNSLEREECEKLLGTSEGKTVEDLISYLNAITGWGEDKVKEEMKKLYPDVTDWSF